MADYVRVRNPGACALLHPTVGVHVTPKAEERFAPDDVLVLAYPWAFGTEAELSAEHEAAREVESVQIEQATRAPGEKRTARTRKSQE